MQQKKNTLEQYLFALIARREGELAELIKQKDATYNFGGIEYKIYPERSYLNRFHRLTGQIDDLYMCLTGHDNKYNENNQ